MSTDCNETCDFGQGGLKGNYFLIVYLIPRGPFRGLGVLVLRVVPAMGYLLLSKIRVVPAMCYLLLSKILEKKSGARPAKTPKEKKKRKKKRSERKYEAEGAEDAAAPEKSPKGSPHGTRPLLSGEGPPLRTTEAADKVALPRPYSSGNFLYLGAPAASGSEPDVGPPPLVTQGTDSTAQTAVVSAQENALMVDEVTPRRTRRGQGKKQKWVSPVMERAMKFLKGGKSDENYRSTHSGELGGVGFRDVGVDLRGRGEGVYLADSSPSAGGNHGSGGAPTAGELQPRLPGAGPFPGNAGNKQVLSDLLVPGGSVLGGRKPLVPARNGKTSVVETVIGDREHRGGFESEDFAATTNSDGEEAKIPVDSDSESDDSSDSPDDGARPKRRYQLSRSDDDDCSGGAEDDKEPGGNSVEFDGRVESAEFSDSDSSSSSGEDFEEVFQTPGPVLDVSLAKSKIVKKSAEKVRNR